MIISHQERILNIADRIVVVAEGKVRDDGPKDEILPSPIGHQACSVLAGKVEG
jgi:Fe-S cluster assembly ATP-binding protein